MQVSDKGLMALICREGIALGWYRDSRGIPTIGIGHTAMAGPPDPVRKGTLTTREAFDLFRVDVEKYAATVRAAIKETMSQDEFDAFVSICYNIGQDGFAKAAFVKKFNAGDRAGCASTSASAMERSLSRSIIRIASGCAASTASSVIGL